MVSQYPAQVKHVNQPLSIWLLFSQLYLLHGNYMLTPKLFDVTQMFQFSNAILF